MKRDEFWRIIDHAVEASSDIHTVPTTVADLLAKYPPEDVVSFKQHFHELLAESYRWDLWAMGYIVNGGCSDDGFCYFCCWLIGNGSERFKKALADPQSIGTWAAPDECELEELMYVPLDVYKQITGEEFPWSAIDCTMPEEPAGDRWEEDELERLYPDLCARFF